MNVGSLFSGIGGIELGLERAGFKTAWFIENKPYAQDDRSMMPTRKQLSEMTTTGLYALDGDLLRIQEMVKAELVLRGDY